MNRKNIIKKLVSEGLSEKTLVNFSDKQLTDLSKRMIKEQVTTISSIKNDPTITMKADNPKKMDIQNFANSKNLPLKTEPAESEIKELFADEGEDELTLNAGGCDKEIGKKVINFQFKDENFDTKNLPYKIAVPEHTPFKLSNGNYLHSYSVKEYINNENGDVDNSSELYEIKKQIKSGKLNKKNMTEWVEKLVENEYGNVATKNQIMKLIKTKLNEQSPSPVTAPPKTKPTTKPGKPKPQEDDDPYVDPFDPAPGTNPNPKFKKGGKKLSDNLKLKIMSLIDGNFLSSSINENKKQKRA